MRRLPHVLFVAVLIAAAALRFTGLDQDIRRGSPTSDEWENFVGPVGLMWDARSADPNVHGGYPGLFNWVVFLPMGLGDRLGGEAGATLAARIVVAAFATANVLLLYLVVRRSWGAWAALLAAALLAFSRSEVSEAHFITPDLLVVSAFLALLLTARARPGSVWTGVWAGLGTAIKYSGVLLVPALLAELVAQRRVKRLLPAAICGGLAFAAAAPFALLMRRDQKRGVDEFVTYYFGPLVSGRFMETVPRQLGEVLSWIWINLGPVAAALALACALARPRRPLAGPVAVLGASLVVLSFAGQVYPRHILLASAAVTILAGAGFEAARQRLPRWAAALLAGAAVSVPFWRGLEVARGYARPTELDQAAAWIEAQGRPLRVATSLARLRLEGPVEVRTGLRLWEWPAEPLTHYDLVVAPRDVAGRLSGLEVLQTFEAHGNPGGAVIALAGGPTTEPGWPAPSAVRATAPGSERAWDGDEGTAWAAPAGPGWLEAEWADARPLHAIEVTVPAGEGYWPQRLRIQARRVGSAGGLGAQPRSGVSPQGPSAGIHFRREPPDAAWGPVDAIAIRPARAALQRPPHGQVYVLPEPLTAAALRIERRDGGRWGVAEVRVFSPAPALRPDPPR